MRDWWVRAPSTEEEEEEQLQAALRASRGETQQSSAEGATAPSSASDSADPGQWAGGADFVASESVVHVVRRRRPQEQSRSSAASSGSAEPEAEAEPARVHPPSRSSGQSEAGLSFSGIPLAAAQLSARTVVGEARLVRAYQAGCWARAKLGGLLERVPRSERLEGSAGRRRLFVIILARPGLAQRGLAAYAYERIKGYVEVNGQLEDSCIFHGFASQAEALEYWQAVYGRLPWPVLPPRP